MGPLMQFEVPLCREFFIAYGAIKRFLAGVSFEVGIQGALQIDAFADRTFSV